MSVIYLGVTEELFGSSESQLFAKMKSLNRMEVQRQHKRLGQLPYVVHLGISSHLTKKFLVALNPKSLVEIKIIYDFTKCIYSVTRCVVG